jgi:hypothetical protein
VYWSRTLPRGAQAHGSRIVSASWEASKAAQPAGRVGGSSSNSNRAPQEGGAQSSSLNVTEATGDTLAGGESGEGEGEGEDKGPGEKGSSLINISCYLFKMY